MGLKCIFPSYPYGIKNNKKIKKIKTPRDKLKLYKTQDVKCYPPRAKGQYIINYFPIKV
jgi:hypothetical protein